MNKVLYAIIGLVVLVGIIDGAIFLHKKAPAVSFASAVGTTTVAITATTTPAQAVATITPSRPAQPIVTPPVLSMQYPLHTNITATVFWVGEPVGNGSSEDNSISAWDDFWEKDYGGYDDYVNRNGYYPAEFTPKENPFYLDLPYDDFDDNGDRRPDAYKVVPWAGTQVWADDQSMMKNRWVKITKGSDVCYGQIEDSGPYVYDDYNYVFSTTDARPASQEAQNAGMDVSPALRDCLGFNGLNNDENKVDWQFINASDVPSGPWTQIVTTQQVNWN